MTMSNKFSLVVMDSEKISQFIPVIVKYGTAISKSSSHALFKALPVDQGNLVQDLFLFRLESENKAGLDKKLNDLRNELNQLDSDYSLRNEDTKEMIEYVEYVGSVDILFDKLNSIPKGTYKKIDELKSAKTEFGYCKGYKPIFRPLEGKTIDNKQIKAEHIYVFSNTRENIEKLKEYISEKIMEINPKLTIEYRQFT